MKTLFLAVALFSLFITAPRELQAQVYGPYYGGPYYAPYWDLQYQQYLQWQQYLQYLQQYDPYYDLHLIHYELYLRPYQPYQYYAPCCFAFGVPTLAAPVVRVPPAARNRPPRAVRRR